ncbi:porin [Paraburkholderia sp. MM5384-R2]|uniref:porin n=1 Tax=Paraburkholderia sp. MM5384-R2 TaxID=2723097 RepID=UPI001622F6F3|nr:porin [Paraburkholderia sp. MM5384-R2]
MKKTFTAVAASSVFVAAGAHAQSSVTLYGLIDAGLTYTNNQAGHAAWQETSGSISGSRWGLRGSEDLGGGLKAVFKLENGFGINNGTLKQSGREFGRQAFVGIGSDKFGTVKLGRQYDSVVDYVGPFSLTGTEYGGTQFAHPFDNDNLSNSFRVNNSVKYDSVNFGGVKVGALYGFSNQAGSFANNRVYSIGASYHWGGLNVGAGYLQMNNDPNNLLQAASNGGAVTGDATFAAGRQQTWGAGFNYAFGPATAGFVYAQTNLSQLSGINASNAGTATTLGLNRNSAHFQNFEVNGRYLITPALSVAASYVYTMASVEGRAPKWNQVNLQAAYALSKRTSIYVQSEYQHISQDGLPIGADIYGLSASSNQNQVAVTAGMRHSF